MKYLRLFLHMARYKSALVLVLFMLLSVMVHDRSHLSIISIHTVFAGLALVFVYACATCINDLADWKIDAINLQGHPDRPLITGEGSRKDLMVLLIFTAAIAVGLAALVNDLVVVAVVAGLCVNALYSLPPLRISYKAILTPFYLALCYVLIPYQVGFGVVSSRANVDFNWRYLVAFYFLFLARICLKDFRDRKGDALSGKPTLILKYGKKLVCLISVVSVLVGSSVLIILLAHEPFLQWLVVFFVASLIAVEYKLFVAKTESLELLSIGYGARMGNGILFALLGTFLLRMQNAMTSDLIVFYCSLATIYGWLFWQYIKHPEVFYFGKKKVTA
jgi:4-hydroxybenzoate polyprenyltransferase